MEMRVSAATVDEVRGRLQAAILQFEGEIGHQFVSLYNQEAGRIELPDGCG